MKYIKINKEDLDRMKLIYPNLVFERKNFSNIYFDYNNLAYKILEQSALSDIDIKELLLLNKINIDSIIKPINIVNIDGLNKGFTMEYFNGKSLDYTPNDYESRIKILKNAKNNLLEIHDKGIIVGDVHSGNILYNSKFETKFCDADGMIISKDNPKRMNNLEREYFEIMGVVDKTCDIYLFNILTLAILLNRNPFRIGWIYSVNFGNLELDKIVEFLSKLKYNKFSENFIIDYIPETKKEFKKLTRRIK